MPDPKNWYLIEDVDQVDTPAFVIYLQRVKKNIQTLIGMIDDPSRLRPHIKTHKSREGVRLCMDAGILKFKCATIAEAELLALSGAPDILLAYQPSVPKITRLLHLASKYPGSRFSCLIDNLESAKHIAAAAAAHDLVIPVYLDLNTGMNRTGIEPGEAAMELYRACSDLKGIQLNGLHVYDGHIHERDLEERTRLCEAAFEPVDRMRIRLTEEEYQVPSVIAGGTPTFPIHAKRSKVECSPGTFIFWDKGYMDLLPEQPFVPAALVISRVISLPDETTLCLDLGYKSIAAEKDLKSRVFFLNAPEFKFIGHSEEHLVVDAGIGHSWKIGDVLYGIPVHVCPTCALYETAYTIDSGALAGSWEITGRKRSITV